MRFDSHVTSRAGIRLFVLCSLSLLASSPVFGIIRYSPQLAVGTQGGITAEVDLTFMNTTSLSQRIEVVFFGSDGNVIGVDVQSFMSTEPSLGIGSIGFDLPAGRTRSLNVSSSGELKAGWIRIDVPNDDTEEGVVIQVTFKNLDQNGM